MWLTMRKPNRWPAAQRTSSRQLVEVVRIATNSRPRQTDGRTVRGAVVEPSRRRTRSAPAGPRRGASGAARVRRRRPRCRCGRRRPRRAPRLVAGRSAGRSSGSRPSRSAGIARLRALDEPLEAAMEQRLADAVEHERLEVRKGGREALERLVGHVAVDEALPGRLLHAHGAAEVAARRDLDEELGRMRAPVGRHRVEQGERRSRRCAADRRAPGATASSSIPGGIDDPRGGQARGLPGGTALAAGRRPPHLPAQATTS